jgi:hypothetical protein
MLPHELLRAAATIVEAGWASGCDAQDLEGRPIPLYAGDARAAVNPAAVWFSAYGWRCGTRCNGWWLREAAADPSR